MCDELPVGVALAPTDDRPAVSARSPPQAREEIERAPAAARAEATLRWWLTAEAAVRACGAGRDQAAECLARVTGELGHPHPEAMVAVAACTNRAVHVRWRVLTPAQVGAA